MSESTRQGSPRVRCSNIVTVEETRTEKGPLENDKGTGGKEGLIRAISRVFRVSVEVMETGGI